jgi:hypothetical protein
VLIDSVKTQVNNLAPLYGKPKGQMQGIKVADDNPFVRQKLPPIFFFRSADLARRKDLGRTQHYDFLLSSFFSAPPQPPHWKERSEVFLLSSFFWAPPQPSHWKCAIGEARRALEERVKQATIE